MSKWFRATLIEEDMLPFVFGALLRIVGWLGVAGVLANRCSREFFVWQLSLPAISKSLPFCVKSNIIMSLVKS